MIEDFVDALQNFRRNKTRTLLSLLGVIIGVASVIVITSMGASSTQQLKDTFGASGLDMVSVTSGFMRRRRDSVSVQFNESFRAVLFDGVRNIRKIWYKNSMNGTLSFGETSVSTSCDAVEAGYLEALNAELLYGRLFGVTDDVEGTQKIILGSAAAEALFPAGDGEGKRILVSDGKASFSFEVIGAVKELGGFGNAPAYITRGFYGKKISPNPDAATVMVQVVSPDKATEVANDITALCTEMTGTEYSVNVTSMQTMIEQMDSMIATMSVLLGSIAAISLLVGGIGIMNIMIVTVTERRQEIGIRKALGATPAQIRRQFLVESAAITLIGGAAGIALGTALSLCVEYVRQMSYVVNGGACLVAFAFSVAVGVFFGMNPAARAARLDPVLALSGE